MKILVVSNLYPPNYIGGYEIGCCDFVNYVRKNTNHSISVLTSNYGTSKGVEAHVKRELITAWGYSNKNRVYVFFKNWHKEIQNRIIFKETIKKFRPDKIIFWSTTGISLSLTNICKKEKIKFSIYVFDEQYARLNEDFFFRQIRKLNKNFIPYLENLIFASNFLKKSFINSRRELKKNSIKHHIINWGVPTQKKKKFFFLKKIKILYVGQIIEHKGLHVLLKAISLLEDKIKKKIEVNIYGEVMDKEYFSTNLNFLKKNKLKNIVNYKKKFQRNELKKIMTNHEILVFPSTWNEPFAITLLEAQSYGLTVVASKTGGTEESITQKKSGLLFKNKSSKELSKILTKLILNKNLIKKFSLKAQNNIEKKYKFGDACKKILKVLKGI